MLSQSDYRFIDRRRKLLRAWPYVGAVLLVVFVLLLLYLYWQSPLLVNPAEVTNRIEDKTLSPATMQLAAVMLPILMLACFVIVLAVILFLFATMAKERTYLDIVDRLMSHRSKFCAVLFALLLTSGGCSPDQETRSAETAPVPQPRAEGELSVVRKDRSTETRYTVKAESCTIEWTVHKTEINKGIIQHRAYCSRSLPEQIPLMARVLRHILHTDEAAQNFTTLFWGRLNTDINESHPPMSMRLALAAACSPSGMPITASRWKDMKTL